jgi:phage protein D
MAQKSFNLSFDGDDPDTEFYGNVLGLEIREDLAASTTCRITLATALQDDGTWAYLTNDSLALFTNLTVRLGFTDSEGLAGALGAAASAIVSALGGGASGDDGLVPLFDGYITCVELELSSEPSGSTIVITATDPGVLLSLEEKAAAFTNMADSDIVQQLVGGYGIDLVVTSTPTVHQDNDTTVMQHGSDFAFIRELARRNGMEFYFEPNLSTGVQTAYFQPPQLTDTPQPDLAIQFGDASNLRSFSARLEGQLPLSVKSQQVDVRSAAPVTSVAPDTELEELGATDAATLIGDPLDSLVTPQDSQSQMLLVATPTSDATELQTMVQAVRDEASWIIRAKGEVNTDAYQFILRPHRLVLVKGAGLPYSGKYYVTRVVHLLKSDGTYTQNFEARRNARDVDGSEEFGGASLGIAIPGL